MNAEHSAPLRRTSHCCWILKPSKAGSLGIWMFSTALPLESVFLAKTMAVGKSTCSSHGPHEILPKVRLSSANAVDDGAAPIS